MTYAKTKLQWCRRCQQDKPVREFYESHRTRCMRCMSECAKERLADPVKRQQQRDRCKKNYYEKKNENTIPETKRVR